MVRGFFCVRTGHPDETPASDQLTWEGASWQTPNSPAVTELNLVDAAAVTVTFPGRRALAAALDRPQGFCVLRHARGGRAAPER